MLKSSLSISCVPGVTLKLRNASGLEFQIEAIVDTGFNSTLSIPPSVAAALKLQREYASEIMLADGTRHNFDFYKVEVEWDGIYREVVASAMGTVPLIGMRLLRGQQLRIDVTPFGKLEIEALPIPPRS